MGDIKFMLKPDSVSWDEVQECHRKAHEKNNKKGFQMHAQALTGEDLRKDIGDGFCFVALDEDKVVGTASLVFSKSKFNWWTRQKVAYTCYDGILPDYWGTDVFFGLDSLRNRYILESGVKIRQCNTAENNKSVIKLCKRGGYKLVQYSATGRGASYYSVIMCKWDDGCPYSDTFCNFMFKLSRFVIKALWKPGYKFRFWIN
jgi:hypothetical protein